MSTSLLARQLLLQEMSRLLWDHLSVPTGATCRFLQVHPMPIQVAAVLLRLLAVSDPKEVHPDQQDSRQRQVPHLVGQFQCLLEKRLLVPQEVHKSSLAMLGSALVTSCSQPGAVL